MRQAALRRLGRVLSGAAVVLDEPVAHRSCARDAQHRVGFTRQLHVTDGVVAAVAPAELPAFIEHDRVKYLCAGTGQLVAHATAVAEPGGDDMRRVDAKVFLDQLDHVVGESQVSSTGVRPSVADPLGRHENRAVLRLFLESVVGKFVLRGAPGVDVVGKAAVPVKPEDQPVGVVLVVVVGKPDEEAAALAAALHRVPAAHAEAGGKRLRLACQRRGLPASYTLHGYTPPLPLPAVPPLPPAAAPPLPAPLAPPLPTALPPEPLGLPLTPVPA